jgi:energy-coupling factor transport system substrate-specific component
MKYPSMVAKRVALVGLLSAILLAAQLVLSGLANIELVTLLITLFTLHFRRLTLYIIYVFVLAEGLLFGFGMWWFSYLYLWAILYVVVWLLRGNTSVFVWVFVNGIFGLLFGALTALPYFITAGIGGGVAYFIAGIPFDIVHGIGNVCVAALLFRPLNRLLERTRHYME